MSPGILRGVILGTLVGAAIGGVIGVVAFEPGSPGMWAVIVAAALFGLMVGSFWGGMSRLGPPAEVDDPLPREPREPGSSSPSFRGPRSEVVE